MTPCGHVTLPELDKVFQLITSIQVFQTGFYTHFSTVLSGVHPLLDSSYSTWSVTGMENAMTNFSCMLCWNEWCLGTMLHRCLADGRLTSLVKFGRPVNVMSRVPRTLMSSYVQYSPHCLLHFFKNVTIGVLFIWVQEALVTECQSRAVLQLF